MKRIALLLSLAALLLTGCEPVISGQSADQAATGGPVRIVTSTCFGDNAAGDPVDDTTTCDDANGAFANMQVLAAYEVPEDATAESVKLSGLLDAELVPSESLTERLEIGRPAPEGKKWLGFRSDRLAVPKSNGTPTDVVATFEPPSGAEFEYRVLLALRQAGSQAEAEAPITCEENADVCKGVHRLKDVPDGGVVKLRDATLGAGEPASAESGTRATVPFTLHYSGSAPSGDLALSATTTVPGAVAAPDPATLQLGSSTDAPVGVGIDVPAGTAPGDYDVALKLETPGGATREATGRVTVTAPPPPPPATAPAPVEPAATPAAAAPAKLRIGRAVLRSRSIRTIRREGLRLRQPISAPGTVRWSIGRLARPVAHELDAAGRAFARIRLSKRGRKALRGRRHATIVLRTTLVDTLGRRVTKRARIRLEA